MCRLSCTRAPRGETCCRGSCDPRSGTCQANAMTGPPYRCCDGQLTHREPRSRELVPVLVKEGRLVVQWQGNLLDDQKLTSVGCVQCLVGFVVWEAMLGENAAHGRALDAGGKRSPVCKR
jgi:hypothetical protein